MRRIALQIAGQKQIELEELEKFIKDQQGLSGSDQVK